MNRNKYFMISLCALLISSSTVFAGPRDWIEDKIIALKFAYKRWNTPSPRLIKDTVIELDGKKFKEFRFDTSHDSEDVTMLREKLYIPGVYVSEGFDYDMYINYIKTNPLPRFISLRQLSMTIEAKMDTILRFLAAAVFRDIPNVAKMSAYEKKTRERTLKKVVAGLPLLWEVEYMLPKDLDSDVNGDKFIEFAKKLLHSFSPDQRKIGNLLYVWNSYSLRFNNNKGLKNAVKRYSSFIRYDRSAF